MLQHLKNVFSSNSSRKGTRPLQGDELLYQRDSHILSEIYRLSRVSEGSYSKLYKPALVSMAEHVQLLPGSESHHHSYAGGLLDHILETVCYALRIRSGIQLPVGEPPETIRVKTDLYTYAIFVAALMHDIGKPAVDVEVMLLDSKGQELGQWNPYEQSIMKMRPATYTFRFCRDRKYQLHNHVSSVLLTKIIPPDGINWLASDKLLFNDLLGYIQGGNKGVISEIASKADKTSVANALGQATSKIKGEAAKTTVPFEQKIITALRTITQNELTRFNGKGALGWYDGNHCWFVSKSLIDSLREQFRSDGVTGMPSDNKRIFDVMVEGGIVVPNNGKAIWRVNIELDDWKPGELTVLKINKSVLWDDDPILDVFEGKIMSSDVNEEKSETTSIPQSNNTNELLGQLLDISQKPTKERKDTKRIKQDEVRLSSQGQEETNEDDFSSIFISDNETAKEPDSTKVESEKISNVLSLNFDGGEDIGTSFLIWLKDGIQSKKIRYNAREYPVHILEEGVLLVSPLIFKKYGEAKKQDWSKVQSSFQKLRINRKNSKGENWHKVRVNGDRTASVLKGWLVPVDEIFEDGVEPKINQNLTLLDIKLEK